MPTYQTRTLWIPLKDVPDLVHALTGETITRQTVYNWAFKGLSRGLINPTRLQVEKIAGRWRTTRPWVQAFLEKTQWPPR